MKTDKFMDEKVEELWYNGHADELAYYGLKCADAALEGYNEGRAKSIAGSLIGGTICVLGGWFIASRQAKHHDESKEGTL